MEKQSSRDWFIRELWFKDWLIFRNINFTVSVCWISGAMTGCWGHNDNVIPLIYFEQAMDLVSNVCFMFAIKIFFRRMLHFKCISLYIHG